MKKLRVLKFGGSSVGNPENIRRAAQIVFDELKDCQKIVVVVSAMGDTTDDLIDLAKKVSPHSQSSAYRREMDMLLSAGERISMSLLSMALADLGVKSRSFTGSQSGIITDTSHGEARIDEIRCFRIEEHLRQNDVAIVAGFQGVSQEKEITTLGRGGSDTSAVALGIALNSDDITIYKDVSGFYSADPRQIPGAHIYRQLDIDIAYGAATRGSQVLHSRCLELAAKFQKTLLIKNTFDPKDLGTLIKEGAMSMEGPAIKSLSVLKNMFFLTAKAPSTRVLKPLVEKGIRPLQVEWNNGILNFILPENHLAETKELLKLLSFEENSCFCITLMGYGFESHPELTESILEKIPPNVLIKNAADASKIFLALKSSANADAISKELHLLLK